MTQTVGRSNGDSAVAKAAYRSAESLVDEHEGRTHNYARKKGVVHKEILVPDNAPDWAGVRSELWNKAQSCEKRKDARYAREFVITLQRELTREQNIAVAREYAQFLVSQGMVVDLTVHDKDVENPNPHAHIMATTRLINENGFGKKPPKWDSKETLIEWRKAYQDITNKHLREHGHEVQIDMRSYKDQGSDKKPMIHMGNAATQLERKGIKTEKGNYNRQIAEQNRQVDEVNRQIAEASEERERLKKETAKEQAPNKEEEERAEQLRAQIGREKKQLERDIESLRRYSTEPERGIPTYQAMETQSEEDFDIEQYLDSETAPKEQETPHNDILDLKAQIEKEKEQLRRDIEELRENSVEQNEKREVPTTQGLEVHANQTVQETQEQKPEISILPPQSVGAYPISGRMQAVYAAEAKKMAEEKRQEEARKQAQREHDIEQEPETSIPSSQSVGAYPVSGRMQAVYAAKAEEMAEEKRQEERAKKQAREGHNIEQAPKPVVPIIHPMGIGGLHTLYAEEAKKMEEEKRNQGQTEHVTQRGVRTGVNYEKQSAPHHDGRDEVDELYKREARTLYMEDKTGNGRDPPTKQR